MKFLDGFFKGNVSSLSDILPCPRCNSLRSKAAPHPSVPYYERRYQCKDCGQFYRFDARPLDDNPHDVMERIAHDNSKSKLILPR